MELEELRELINQRAGEQSDLSLEAYEVGKSLAHLPD